MGIHNTQGEATTPSEKEFYHHGFKELCQLVGEAKALDRVQYYLKESERYADTPTFVIHNCRLLTTYQDPSQEPEPVADPTPLDRYCSVFYAPIRNVTNQKPLTLWQVADLIRSERFKPETDHLRTIADEKANRKYKSTAFCYATFSGTFSHRADANLIEHSGLICIDLDNLNDRLNEIRAIVNADSWTVMSFTSPNGDGLKVLYETDASLSQRDNYIAFSNHLGRLCQLDLSNIDKSCKDVSRACFLPHDPALFIHPHFKRAA